MSWQETVPWTNGCALSWPCRAAKNQWRNSAGASALRGGRPTSGCGATRRRARLAWPTAHERRFGTRRRCRQQCARRCWRCARSIRRGGRRNWLSGCRRFTRNCGLPPPARSASCCARRGWWPGAGAAAVYRRQRAARARLGAERGLVCRLQGRLPAGRREPLLSTDRQRRVQPLPAALPGAPDHCRRTGGAALRSHLP